VKASGKYMEIADENEIRFFRAQVTFARGMSESIFPQRALIAVYGKIFSLLNKLFLLAPFFSLSRLL
jgi:hypothetical protein